MSTESSPASASKPRSKGHRFQPGQSGNRAGKPKGTRARVYAALDAAAAEHMPEIVKALVEKAKATPARPSC